MKKLLFLLLGSVLLGSCDIHTSGNGDLDGYWCLTQVDSLHNGKSVEYREQRVFWSFAAGLMTVRQMPSSKHPEYVCHFEHEGATLRLGEVYLLDRVAGDRPITQDSLFVLRPMGINAFRESFGIEKLSGSDMSLKGDMLRLHFERY